MLILPTITFFLFLASLGSTQSNTNCSIFTWDTNPPRVTTYPPIRVSAAESCPSNSTDRCPITSTGHEQFLATSNITSLSLDALAPLVHAAVPNNTMSGEGFNASVTGSVEMQYSLSPGQTGYLNITVSKMCYNGTVAGCTGGGGIENGTGVEICAPIWTFNGMDIRFSANWTIQNVSVEDLDRYPDPYEGQDNRGSEDEGDGANMLRAGMMHGGLAVFIGIVAILAA
ncbi:hypothetical protein BJX63DRAFT_41448 [Aspergillus granulosus]|uniref:Uncharacterized protein n=1 Tax=Aspergillus granulosus TaxID=176169 RepID=A0ABR4GY79_9EURO